MKLSELQYELPDALIAQQPLEPRDAARLLIVQRASGRLDHRVFREIGDYLRAGDLLVVNDTRVIPARFFARRETGGRVEGLFLREAEDGWRALLNPAGRIRPCERLQIELPGGEIGTEASPAVIAIARHERGEWTIRPDPPTDPRALLERVGHAPLPPYIQRGEGPSKTDTARYQTVYAASSGAVAAPTAGLHFTPQLLDSLAARGIQRAAVTLHVGLGTFSPIEVEDLAEHKMHREWFSISADALARIRATRHAGGRIVAVGTTSARVLESINLAEHAARSGWTDIFIQPPYEFRNVDVLLTNFHLPGSTLLALVMALAGSDLTRAAYRAAIKGGYRFYSYGDAMLIL